jgi:hypothetical protein
MRKLLIFVFILASTGMSLAQRPSTLAMSCRQAQSLIARNGAMVLTTGRHTYDRFVASDRYCMPGEYLYPAHAPTSDASQCSLGYTCSSIRPPWLDDDDFRGGFLFGR